MIDFLIILGVVWLIFAIVQDLRKREIANWLNFSLIIFAMTNRLLYSVFSNDYGFVLTGLFGLVLFFLLANLFYYMRLFAGGDAKLMIALGALLPFTESFYTNSLIFFVFVIALLLGGVVYSLIYSLGLVFINKTNFTRSLKHQIAKNENYIYLGLGIGLLFIILALFLGEVSVIFLGVLIMLIPLFYIYTKAIETSCMMVYIDPKNVSVGDWVVEEIKLPGKKTIKPHWEGLSEEQVSLIKKYYKKKVLVKQGIPFSPSFFLAFLVLIYVKYFNFGNWNYPFGF